MGPRTMGTPLAKDPSDQVNVYTQGHGSLWSKMGVLLDLNISDLIWKTGYK